MERCFGGIEVARLKGHLALLKPGLRLDWVRGPLRRVHCQDAHPSLQGVKRTGREKERRGGQQDSRTEFHSSQVSVTSGPASSIAAGNSSGDGGFEAG